MTDRSNNGSSSRVPESNAVGVKSPVRNPWREELAETFRLAWPLVIAQVAHMSLITTDVVMMGWLGPVHLGAGSLAMSIIHPIFLFGIGTLTAVAALVAQARGARDIKGIRRSVRQGLWVAVLLSLVLVPLTLQTGRFLHWSGQSSEITVLAQSYAGAFAWAILPALGFMVLRAFVSALGSTTVVLWVTLAGFVVNAVMNYALMFGNWGFPRLELVGAGLSTFIVDLAMMLLLYLYIHRHRRFRRYHILVRLWRPDWARFRKVLRIGLPVGLMLLSETGMFAVAAIMMGWIGTDQLAGHAIALQCAALAFMVPLGLSQATTIRVGLGAGRGARQAIGVAGWTSQGLGLAFMTVTCCLFVFFPGVLVSLFLDTNDPANLPTLKFAAAYLGIAALFQLADSGQVMAAASLRGLSDTRTPLALGLIGYWVIGIPVGYGLGFHFGLDGVGIWIGLATGLAFVAIVLTLRFALRERLGLLRQ